MKWFAIALAFGALLLQYRLWLSGDGLSDVLRQATVSVQQTENARLSDAIAARAEVRD
jgi:cell division protein FtsB